MIRYYLKAISIVAFTGLLGSHALAQQNDLKEKLGDNDEIIIRKKAGGDVKVTVEVKDGEVKVNGKPISEYDDDNVTIRKRGATREPGRLYTPPTSPFRGGVWNYSDDNENFSRAYAGNANRPLLGVLSDKDENGAKITSITKGSAAEKAGLKEGDIITKVDEMPVTGPEDLTRAIGKFKPEEKATISFKRGRKEQKATVTLGKRTDAARIIAPKPPNAPFPENFEPVVPNMEDFNFAFRSNSPRLGIKAQETEDGKGVKVLDIGEESNAQKAGIKEGDILLEFDGKAVNSASELADAAKGAKDKNSIKVKLNREGKSQEVEIKIPKKLKTTSL